MIIKKYIFAAALCFGLSTHAFADEKVTNGTFDGSLRDWTFSSAITRGLSQVSNTGVVDTAFGGSQTITQMLTLSAGTYSLAFSNLLTGRFTTLEYSIAGLIGGTLSGTQIGNFKDFFTVTGSEPMQYLLSFTGTARGIGGIAVVDNVSVNQITAVPGPEAGAGLGALAMGGMALWVRRRRMQQEAA
jgi:hypothetical protein